MKKGKSPKLNKQFRKLLIVDFFYLLFGLALIIIGIYSIYLNIVIIKNARQTTGIIIREHNVDAQSRVAVVDAKYTVNDTTYKVFNRLNRIKNVKSDSVPIVYDITNPGQGIIGYEADTNFIPGILILLAGLAFSIFNFYRYVKDFNTLRDNRQLFHHYKLPKNTGDVSFLTYHFIVFKILTKVAGRN